jgi:hypothetical protein
MKNLQKEWEDTYPDTKYNNLSQCQTFSTRFSGSTTNGHNLIYFRVCKFLSIHSSNHGGSCYFSGISNGKVLFESSLFIECTTTGNFHGDFQLINICGDSCQTSSTTENIIHGQFSFIQTINDNNHISFNFKYY